MDRFSNNRGFSVHEDSSQRTTERGRRLEADVTGDLSAAVESLGRARVKKPKQKRTRIEGDTSSTRSARETRRTDKKGADKGTRRPSTSRDARVASTQSTPKVDKSSRAASRRAGFMQYANDNAAVQALYHIVTGPYRVLFYLIVIASVVFGLYFPVRDMYIAHRNHGLLQEQLKIRSAYNEMLQKEVNSYLSNEGIEDTARTKFGMVKEGETRVDLVGVDENGDPLPPEKSNAQTEDKAEQQLGANGDESDENSAEEGDTSKTPEGENQSGTDASIRKEDTASHPQITGKKSVSSSADKNKTSRVPKTAAEVEDAVRHVYENSPWFYRLLDTLFFYSGTEGQAVVSAGRQGSMQGSASSS
ncbi:septum formation initiator family protein [Collinsella sp. zg1085]|uniref:FtsB family cell division protein n=1 Tax=Collinsella sp. zg1085 TaxID=2844380 RepID=UPI001C0BF2BE|nr:septum formation initiator family protein [Collinsella sp. zg1085]QWT17765.1 septum formation initiator family protein [Collinsella sp. zg1085]